MVPGLAVDRCNEILVLCDLFELLLASIDSSLPLSQDTERRADTTSDDDTLNSTTRTYTCHNYASY
jgi:hypothetical protein